MLGSSNHDHINLESERWSQFYGKLQKEIPSQFFDIFFNDIRPLEWNEDKLIIASSDGKILSHIKNRYMNLLTTFAREVAHKDIDVQLKISDKKNSVNASSKYRSKKQGIPDQFNIFEEEHSSDSRMNHRESSKNYINTNYTFERFVKGPSNEYAYMAVLGAAQNPKKFHNPLYLFGGVGLGKTHLMMAMANYIAEHYPWMKVLYVPSEAFQNDIVEAAQKKTGLGYQAKYRNADVLLIDDIQFISERADYTQEQIFHIFNHLYQNNKQIVISGDRPPQQLATLKDRLISRFQSGLIVDIKPPNLETREAILIKKSLEMELKVPKEVLRFIATHEKSQVRLLEAALIKLKFSSEMRKKEVDMSMANEIVKEISREQKVNISVDDVLMEVSSESGVKPDHILGKSRIESVVWARHIAMYLVRKVMPELTLLNVANAFGRNDHTTVMNAEKKVKIKLDSDVKFSEMVDRIYEILISKTKKT
ncbi:MAG: chromosomal replication initiator protein DnaA [Spirochaetia bacterium]|nr:chromosomal replication initiator protein DnaA [Spirochaetia bacterium]